MSIKLPKKIGLLEIYDEQAKCAREIIDIFQAGKGPPLLIAQMQQGKTGVCIDVAKTFIDGCNLENKKHEVIFLTNIADNTLRSQTQFRLQKAGIDQKVKNIHHSSLRDFTPDPNVDVRLIIIDECHVALERSNSDDLKPFHEFMKKCGIKYGESVDKWENKNNYVLSVSATPYAHVIWQKIKNEAFKPVVLTVSDKYYSLQDMQNAGRFKKSEYCVKNGVVTTFFKDRVAEFIDMCKKDSNAGHMIIRAIGASPEAIRKYIEENYQDRISVNIFESVPVNNIHLLDETIREAFPKPYISIIRGSLRAGKTLTTTKHIKMWIDSPKSKTDTMCQVVGRCLGFEMEGIPNGNGGIDWVNRKTKDTFPVYCDIKELNDALEFYKTYECVPSGNYNKKTKSISNVRHVIKIDDGENRGTIHRLSKKEKNEIRDILLEKLIAEMKKLKITNLPKTVYVANISQQKSRDICKNILNNVSAENHKDEETGETEMFTLFYCDGVTEPEHQSSLENLKIKYPDCMGKYFISVAEDTDEVINNYSQKIKDECIIFTS